MKFAEHLSAHNTPEWRKQYITYEEMKAMLYTAVAEAPSVENVEPEIISRHFATFDEIFFKFCDRELKKINTFYSEKLAEATRKYAELQSELDKASETQHGGGKNRSRTTVETHLSTQNLRKLKIAFSELYLSLILLQNFQILNYTGFRKILKKHDELLSGNSGAKWCTEFIETSYFHTSKDVDKLIRETEETVTAGLEGGDRKRAMKRLRMPPLGERRIPWTSFKVGLLCGSFIVLFIAVVLSAIFHDGGESLKVAFSLYRGPLLIIQILFLVGVNVYGWRSSGVNHVLIFELDPRNHLSEQHIMEMAALLGVVWTLSLLSFLYSASLSIPPYVNPLAFVGFTMAFLFNPLKIFRHEARFWLLRILWRVIITPLVFVNFADLWLADQLYSLPTVLLDFHFLICFYITNGNWLKAGDTSQCMSDAYIVRSIINCLPAWFRFAQCIRLYRDSKKACPHLVNAGKYSTTFFVVITNTLRTLHVDEYDNQWDSPWHWMWIASSFICSSYSYAWDLKIDWGLLSNNAGENRFLREEIVYSSTGVYYFAIVEDLILRFAWIPSYMLIQYGYVASDVMTSISAPLEVFRRFIWNFFRLENEHLNNCDKFQAVRHISVAPIERSDQNHILRMMDEENGVLNIKKRKGSGKK